MPLCPFKSFSTNTTMNSTKYKTVVRGPPEWTQHLQFNEEMNGGFNGLSDGMVNLSPFHVVRERPGIHVTDAARWAKGITEGKHVFLVDWPEESNRGIASCIGLAPVELPLRQQGRVSLVGSNSRSWGFDLRKRRSFHLNQPVNRMAKALPQRFYIYVDMDGGKIGFGDDVNTYGKDAEFFGYLINDIRKSPAVPLYLTVSCCNSGEQIQVYYKGSAVMSGGFDLCAREFPCHISKPGLYPSMDDPMDQPPRYSSLGCATYDGVPGAASYLEPVKTTLPTPQGYNAMPEKGQHQRF